MKNALLYILLGGLSLGCTDRYLGNDSTGIVKNEKVKTVRLADLSRWGIFEGYGFVKWGDMVTVGAGNITTINLTDPNKEALVARGVPSGEQHRDLSAFNSSDGKMVTALDFRKGELIEKSISSLARFDNQETVIHLPSGQQHLIAVKVGDFVIATGLYEEGRYLLYSLSDKSARYFLSYPEHPVYSDLQEKTIC